MSFVYYACGCVLCAVDFVSTLCAIQYSILESTLSAVLDRRAAMAGADTGEYVGVIEKRAILGTKWFWREWV